jgi:ectoine hydroxylase-related dioxygenase (phytanoyl-CoA dioxygenase family)
VLLRVLPRSHKLDAHEDHPDHISQWSPEQKESFHPDAVRIHSLIRSWYAVLRGLCRTTRTSTNITLSRVVARQQVAAEAPAGSVLLFDCRLYHTKAPNDTATERLAVQVRYGAQWFYTRLNHSGHQGSNGPPLQEEVLQQLPESVRPRFQEY